MFFKHTNDFLRHILWNVKLEYIIISLSVFQLEQVLKIELFLFYSCAIRYFMVVCISNIVLYSIFLYNFTAFFRFRVEIFEFANDVFLLFYHYSSWRFSIRFFRRHCLSFGFYCFWCIVFVPVIRHLWTRKDTRVANKTRQGNNPYVCHFKSDYAGIRSYNVWDWSSSNGLYVRNHYMFSTQTPCLYR